MDILEMIEEAKKGAEQMAELGQNIGTLTKSMNDLMNDCDKKIIACLEVGLTVSLSIAGKETVIGCFGNKTGIESALENLQKTIKEQCGEDANEIQ